ncbi:type I-E CRISPR-associated protein Cas6/Cse3/CasE [Immundisolibacter sp.]|uniref:type I-E CRISPR-associated protein Cas6/Cse3/CasE n=1 Tax=Immundisolibacter sp. TaxID=1934948 RepID=UPI000EE5352F|nr:type I-E CRISPR-associated protein Cas6/Cse3/CasE [Gammaproteobacteria bacterium]
MFLSVITPTPGSERDAAHTLLGGPYEDHQWLWRFFPNDPDAPRDFLFRRSERDGMARFHMVSARPPVSPDSAWTVQSREYAPHIAPGTHLQFELRANPVVRTRRDGKTRRDDVVMAEKKRLLQARGLARWADWVDEDRPTLYDLVAQTCSAWLRRCGERDGFVLDEGALRVDAYRNHAEKRQLPKERRLRFSSVDFAGVLTVTDTDRLHKALLHGIGPAKAFGCGLLLVRRL